MWPDGGCYDKKLVSWVLLSHQALLCDLNSLHTPVVVQFPVYAVLPLSLPRNPLGTQRAQVCDLLDTKPGRLFLNTDGAN